MGKDAGVRCQRSHEKIQIMQNFERYLHDVANHRRRELIPYVFHSTSGRVQTGPFKNMLISPKSMWGDGDVAGKLLGVYENELHQYIELATQATPDTVINIGSAEGYYSVGMALRLPTVPVTAVDLDPRAAEIVRENAQANQTKNLTAITHQADTKWIELACRDVAKPFLILDCEGAELTLLDPTQAPSLKKSIILVESHDCIIAGITQQLIERFQSTHNITVIDQSAKDPYQFDFLRSVSDCDKWCLVHEGRPSTMQWLFMVPRQ